MPISIQKQPFQQASPDAALPVSLSNSAQGVLNRLRFAASRCRVSARQEFFSTCAQLRGPAGASADAYVMQFIAVLDEALMARVVFYKPGAPELSFDEAWLMSLILSVQRGDHDSFAFLLHRRVTQDKRRPFSELIQGLARSLAA